MGRVMQEELVTWLSGMARVGTRASPRVVVYGFFADVCCSHHLEFPLLCLLPEPQGLAYLVSCYCRMVLVRRQVLRGLGPVLCLGLDAWLIIHPSALAAHLITFGRVIS
ncbi:hypothetical protein YC2023_089373 [Brassica napus]